nr:uncharacterized protein LOC106046933 [Anser cygnoides]
MPAKIWRLSARTGHCQGQDSKQRSANPPGKFQLKSELPVPCCPRGPGTAFAPYQKHVYTSAQQGDRKSTGLTGVREANHSLSCLAFSPPAQLCGQKPRWGTRLLASAQVLLAISSPAVLRLFPKLLELGTPQAYLLRGLPALWCSSPSPSRGRKLHLNSPGSQGARCPQRGATSAPPHLFLAKSSLNTRTGGNNGEKAHPAIVIKHRVSSLLGSGFRKPNHVRGKEKKNLPKHG